MGQAALSALGSPNGELSVVIVDDPAIAELNAQYLGRTGPTNVIAFPMREGDFAEISPHLLGDVVISADTARREAESAGISADDRLIELLVHGILHLFGYDHETDADDADEMERRAEEVLAAVRAERAD
jgi:probable rRNA maturation factor